MTRENKPREDPESREWWRMVQAWERANKSLGQKCLALLRTVRINRAKVECMKNKKEYKRSCVGDS